METFISVKKPKIVLLSYATRNYRISQLLLALTAKLFGVDSCKLKTRKQLEQTEFYKNNKEILDEKTGAGFWLWKPYYINETLQQLGENELLLYVDSGTIIKRSLKSIFRLISLNQPVVLFTNEGPQSKYTKRDIFIYLDCDESKYYNAPMVHANIQLYLNCKAAREFAKTVLTIACKERLITDDDNILGKPNLVDFQVNRHDQSILSLLALKEGITFQLDPTQFRTSNYIFNISKGRHLPNYPIYPTCFFVHRFTNFRLVLILKYVLFKFLRIKKY